MAVVQGPLLEKAGKDIGVVTHIMGPSLTHAIFNGSGGHAGGMPMGNRYNFTISRIFPPDLPSLQAQRGTWATGGNPAFLRGGHTTCCILQLERLSRVRVGIWGLAEAQLGCDALEWHVGLNGRGWAWMHVSLELLG